MLNKNSGDDTLNPVLRASVCWTFGTHKPQILNPDPRSPDFKPDWRRWFKRTRTRPTCMSVSR